MMIGRKEAEQKALEHDGMNVVLSCWEFSDKFVFNTAPAKPIKNQTYDTGTIFTAVDKTTGRVFEYDITSDPDAFLAACGIE